MKNFILMKKKKPVVALHAFLLKYSQLVFTLDLNISPLIYVNFLNS